MQNEWHYRDVTVHLVDGHLCADPSKYVAALLLSLSTDRPDVPRGRIFERFSRASDVVARPRLIIIGIVTNACKLFVFLLLLLSS